MKLSVMNEFMGICNECPMVDVEVDTKYSDMKPYYVEVGCTHKAECARAYDMGRKEVQNEAKDVH